MKTFPVKSFAILVILMITHMTLTAQIMIVEKSIAMTNSNTLTFSFSVLNATPDSQYIHWTLDVESEDLSIDNVVTYDRNLCYMHGTQRSHCGFPNFFQPGEHVEFFKLIVYGFDVSLEEVCITMHFLDDCVENGGDTLLSYRFEYNCSLSAFEETTHTHSQPTIYPNPCSTHFSISDDEKIGHISVFDINGLKVLDNKHISGVAHPIGELASGIYSVIIKDNIGRSLGYQKLVVR